MTCTACTQAAAKVSHLFHADCRGCCARACARGQDFQRVRKLGVLDHRYRLALQHFGLTHDEVKAAAAADRASDTPSKGTRDRDSSTVEPRLSNPSADKLPGNVGVNP